MPRLLILLGIALLLGLLAYVLIGDNGRDPFEAERSAPWTPGAPGTKEGSSGDEEAAGVAPVLKGSARPDAGGPQANGKDAQAAGPTGPYEFHVVDFESEAPLEAVVITGPTAEPLGTTDKDGRLVVEDARLTMLEYRTQLAGYAAHQGRAKPGQITHLVLHLGITIRGRVVRDAGGAPLEDAQVIVWDEDLQAEAAITSTVEGGRFVINSVRPNYPMKLLVLVDGLVPHEQREFFHVDLEDYEIRVGGGGRLIGRVTTPDGKPVPNESMLLLAGGSTPFVQRKIDTKARWAQARLEAIRTAKTTTGEDGRYEFVGAPLRRSVRPALERGQRDIQRARRSAYFRDPDEVIEIDLVVQEAASLRIRVQDDEGEPIGHAELEVRAGNGYWTILPTDSHPEGGYLLEDVEPRRHAFVTARIPGAPDQRGDAKLKAGEQAEVVLTFPRGVGMRGVVRDKRGQPIWKARVTWIGKEKKERAEARADEKGRFGLTRLESGIGTLVVSARDLPWTPRAYETEVFRDLALSGEPLEVTLLDGTRAYGRFEDLPKGAVVTSTFTGGSEYDVTDHYVKEDRRFERRGPPPRGKGVLFVFRTRGFPPLIVKEPRPFSSEERRDLGPLMFEKTNPRQGRVVGDGNRPVHGAFLRIKTPWSSRTTRTDIEGDFSFPRLPDENIPVEIIADGFPRTHAILYTTSQFRRQTVFIRKSGPLFVRVVGPNRIAAAGPVMVRLRAQNWKPGDPRPPEAHAAADARRPAYFHVPPGRYQAVAFDRAANLAGAAEVRVRPGPQQHVELVMRPQKRR